jgi:uncharacterized membrane protein
MKKGITTTEFWTVLGAGMVAVFGPLAALLVAYNVLDPKTAELWLGLIGAIVSLAVAIIPAWLAIRYTQSRTELKSAIEPALLPSVEQPGD